MLEPLLLQNASINGSSKLTQNLIKPITKAYSSLPVRQYSRPYYPNQVTKGSSSNRLRIAWISSDIAHHPVARFLLGFLICFFYPTSASSC